MTPNDIFNVKCTPLPASPAADHVLYWCHGLEVYPWSCSGLPPRSLLSHPGHQRSQFTPLIGIGVTLCSFCSYLHNPGPCILGGRPSVWNGLPLSQRLLPRILSDTFYSSLKTLLSSLQGSGAILSSNLEEALYTSYLCGRADCVAELTAITRVHRWRIVERP